MTTRSRTAGKHRYSSDRPIRSPAEDLLGRAAFAFRLAEDLRAWSGRDSLVLALYGSWGSGKTSVKNLVLSHLNSRRQKKLPVVEFNPWQFAGTGTIASAFFRELAVVLGKDETGAEAGKRAKKLNQYAKRITVGSTAVEKIGTLLTLLGVPGGGIVKAAGQSLQEIAKATQEGSDALGATAQEPTLTDLKAEIAGLLAELKRPVLVVIDDIDRLATDEILQIFQLVKANADFPNLTYLLLFERSIVSNALNVISGNRGDEFLEKIVQVGFHIPQASREEINTVLFSGLDETLRLPGVDTRWERDRWSSLFQSLSGYFGNLRHVYRYLASFHFHVRHFQTGTSFEVNPVDLIALEALRVFEPSVYERLPGAKKFLTRDEGQSLFGEIQQETIDAAVGQIVGDVPEARQPVVRQILEAIFPPITSAYAGRSGVSGDQQAWLRQARPCHPELFDKYFTLVVAPNDLSQADLDRLVAMAGNRQTFVDECRSLQTRGLLNIALERLDAYKTEIPTTSMAALVLALCDLSDGFQEPKPGFESFTNDPLTNAWRLVYWGLRRIQDNDERFSILRAALTDSRGLLLPVDIVSLEQRTKERDEKAYEYLIDEAQIRALTDLCVDKLRQAASNGSLRTHPRAAELLFRWGSFTSIDEIRSWLATQISSPAGATWFLSLVMASSTGGGTTRYYTKLSFVEQYADVRLLEEQTKDVPETDLPEMEKIGLREFRRALRRREKGKPEIDGYRIRDEED